MRVFVFICFVTISTYSFGQGCSDAGVCTSGSHNSFNEDPTSTSFSLGQSFEMGEEHVLISSSIIQIQVKVSSKTSISFKSNYFFVSGNLRNSSGLGDLTGNITHKIFENDNFKFYLNIGGKLPSNSSNKANKQGLPLPMPYQSSLGTYDIMTGGSFYFEKWRFSAGYQHAFNNNNNGFLHSVWGNNEIAQEYFESNLLKRGDDLMIRVERLFKKEKSTFSISILPIYRIQKDEIWKNDAYIKLDGSNQLTINLNLGLIKKVNDKLSIRFSYANPILWRETRADGLTRFFVVYGGINYSF